MTATIRPLPNGPYQLAGAPLQRASGETFPAEAVMYLCRCGGSSKKPFCDGTHRKNGFSDRNSADPAKDRRQAYAGKGITIFDNRALCAHAGYCTDRLASVFRMRSDVISGSTSRRLKIGEPQSPQK